MIILHSGKKIANAAALGLAVLVLAAASVVSVQWFSLSLAELFVVPASASQNALAGSLQTAIAEVLPQLPVAPPPVAEVPKLAVTLASTNEITARAALSLRAPSKTVIFSKNIQQSLPVASLTKLMTALVVMERYNLDQQIVISEEAMKQEGEQGELKTGQIFSVKELLYIMLMESSNRAAFALSDAMGTDNFVILMNETAESLALADTHFVDSTGLQEGSYSSAKDIANLSYHIFSNYPLLRDIMGTREHDVYLVNGPLHHTARTTNSLLGGGKVIAGKTGYTDAAQGCFMVIEKEGDEYIVNVVLGAQDRVVEMKKLMAK